MTSSLRFESPPLIPHCLQFSHRPCWFPPNMISANRDRFLICRHTASVYVGLANCCESSSKSIGPFWVWMISRRSWSQLALAQGSEVGCSGSGSSSDSSCVTTRIILMVGTALAGFPAPDEDAGFGFANDGFLFNAA